MTTSDPRAELQKLQQELSIRQSTTSFAHSAIALVVALLLSGAAAKLFWDSIKLPYLGILAALASVGLALFAVARYRLGKAQMQTEERRFAELQSLKRTLGLDDPAGLLPSR